MLIKQIKDGWNGWSDEDDELGHCEHKAVDAALCQSYIDHCTQELENWIKNTENTIVNSHKFII